MESMFNQEEMKWWSCDGTTGGHCSSECLNLWEKPNRFLFATVWDRNKAQWCIQRSSCHASTWSSGHTKAERVCPHLCSSSEAEQESSSNSWHFPLGWLCCPSSRRNNCPACHMAEDLESMKSIWQNCASKVMFFCLVITDCVQWLKPIRVGDAAALAAQTPTVLRWNNVSFWLC